MTMSHRNARAHANTGRFGEKIVSLSSRSIKSHCHRARTSGCYMQSIPVIPGYDLQGSWPILKPPVQQPAIQGPCVEPQICHPHSFLLSVGRYDGEFVVVNDSCSRGQFWLSRARDTVQVGGHSTGASCAAYDYKSLCLFLAQRMRSPFRPCKSAA